MSRSSKRNMIIAIYAGIFLLFVAFVVMAIMPDPTCFDGKKNQNEEKVDCGGVCGACAEEVVGKDLVIEDTQVLYGGENKYDVIAKVHNPNALFGGKQIYYTMDILDENDHVLTTRSGSSFILPNENKYIVEIGLETAQNASHVKMAIGKVEWVKFADFDSPQIMVRNQRFGLVENTTDYAEAFGLVSNESAYDFHNVTISVMLLDERGVPIAVNKTVQKTLDANSKREFRLTWPHEFPGTIASSYMQAEANVFDSLNFMKKYSPVAD